LLPLFHIHNSNINEWPTMKCLCSVLRTIVEILKACLLTMLLDMVLWHHQRKTGNVTLLMGVGHSPQYIYYELSTVLILGANPKRVKLWIPNVSTTTDPFYMKTSTS